MKAVVPMKRFRPNYKEEKEMLRDFLLNFEDPTMKAHPLYQKKKYKIMMQNVANKKQTRMNVELTDIEEYFRNSDVPGFVESIRVNTMRYHTILAKAIDECMPEPIADDGFVEPVGVNRDGGTKEQLRRKAAAEEQRMMKERQELRVRKLKMLELQQQQDRAHNPGLPQEQGRGEKRNEIPPQIKRAYHLVISPGEGDKMQPVPVRQISSRHIGGLISFRAVVTRTTEVKPSAKVISYKCQQCGSENFQVVNSRSFLPIQTCKSNHCLANQTHGQLVQDTKDSFFEPYQEIRVQEPTDQVPMGSVPRNITLIARRSNVRVCSPGDMIFVTGILVPASSERRFGRRAVSETSIEVQEIHKEKSAYEDMQLDANSGQMFDREAQEAGFFDKISKSICPEIYGHEDVKRALMLLMIGGVDRKLADGMKIRGNLNMLLMGDPGVAKSQLLKHIAHLAPRGVYTTGKGSSGAGLTAAVVKDESTNEMALEAGALVLADTGICCIDEFDKMDEGDRANIHEVMEQHTISIAKAGITTTLNARTSILAAANPINGRYNPKISPFRNINLPPALLSRFDLVFLLLDRVDRQRDRLLASHVTDMHMNVVPNERSNLYDTDFIRSFIAYSRRIDPYIPEHLVTYITERYVQHRITSKKAESQEMPHTKINKQEFLYVTPRFLLGIIRLSQALARLHLREEVREDDINEAIRLIECSRLSIIEDQQTLEDLEISRKQDEQSRVWGLIREMLLAAPESNTLARNELIVRLEKEGVSPEAIEATITSYTMLDSLYVDEEMDTIMLC